MQSGVFGQGENAGNVIRGFWKLIVAGSFVVGVAGCGGSDAARYVGRVTTTQGGCGLGFGPDGTATATLMVRGPDVQFAPSDGVTVLPGHVSDSGHVVAGSSVTGAEKKAFAQVFEGDRKGDEVSGVFATPRCRAVVSLRRG